MNILQKQEHIIAEHLHKFMPEPALADLEFAFSLAKEDCWPLLPMFGTDLASGAAELASQVFAGPIRLTDPRQNNLTGLSGLPFFFVKSEKKIVATIKAFPRSKPTYAEALWAQQNLFRIEPVVPRLRFTGKTVHHGEDYLLLLSDFIPGLLVNDLILNMAALPEGEKRQDAKNQCAHIAKKIGELLGKFHTAGKAHHGPAPRITLEQHMRAQKLAMAGFQQAPQFMVDPARVENAVLKIMATMADHQLRYAPLHGDAHPGNYLYDPHRDQVFALDLDHGACSIGAQGQGLGSPFTDYIKLVSSLKVREIFGITKEETRALRGAFDEGYVASGGTLPTPHVERVYTMMEVLDYAAWYFGHEAKLAPEPKVVMRRILETGIEWLKEILA